MASSVILNRGVSNRVATSTKLSLWFASLEGKIVLPWKPNFPRKGKLYCLAQFAVNWASSRATRSTQECKQGASC